MGCGKITTWWLNTQMLIIMCLQMQQDLWLRYVARFINKVCDIQYGLWLDIHFVHVYANGYRMVSDSLSVFSSPRPCQQSYCRTVVCRHRRPLSIRCPSVVHWIQAKFYWKLPICHISRPFFFFPKFSIFKFLRFFSVSLTWDPMQVKI